MLVRIVRMSFRENRVADFLDVYDEIATTIRSFSGCRHIELWKDADAPAAYTTYTLWTNNEALQTYRESSLFRETWAKIKPMFESPASAHSYHRVTSGDLLEPLG